MLYLSLFQEGSSGEKNVICSCCGDVAVNGLLV